MCFAHLLFDGRAAVISTVVVGTGSAAVIWLAAKNWNDEQFGVSLSAALLASLLAGSLTEMKQLGFALPFGVLLDTFVVRPVLLPAFLILLARLRRWRRKAGSEAA